MTSYQPLARNKFIVKMNNFPSFLVSAVSFPPVIKKNGNFYPLRNGKLIIQLPQTNLDEINPQDFLTSSENMEILFLNAEGTVVARNIFVEAKIEEINFDTLDYNDPGIAMINVQLSFDYFVLTN